MTTTLFRSGCIMVSAIAVLSGLNGCGSGNKASDTPPPLPVQVADARQQDVPLTIEMVGVTRGAQDVPIRARVEGFLESMNFQEGQFVKKGDLLYTIDPQPFQAKLVEAQSQLAAARTSLAKAEADLARIRPLAEMKAVSEQDLDSAIAFHEAARASVRAGEAAVDLAKIELSYTRIHAPIDGLIGLSKAKPGEFVGREPNPVVLNTLSDIDPIRVRFSISEREYLMLARGFLNEEDSDIKATRQKKELALILADGSQFEHPGRLAGSAQSIDPETGTYTVEALFSNPDKLLLPGQFARVRAPYKVLHDVIVVPRKAVTELQGRFRVYVVTPDNTVELREVTLGPITGNDQVIESGLNAGEQVIVEGLQKVRAGMAVQPSPAPEPTTPPPIHAS